MLDEGVAVRLVVGGEVFWPARAYVGVRPVVLWSACRSSREVFSSPRGESLRRVDRWAPMISTRQALAEVGPRC
jgi:hypothetical protein